MKFGPQMNTDEIQIRSRERAFPLYLKSVNRADGISEIEGKAAKGSGERVGRRASFKICVHLWPISSVAEK